MVGNTVLDLSLMMKQGSNCIIMEFMKSVKHGGGGIMVYSTGMGLLTKC